DGNLIDPARCRVAREMRQADWELARTLNGTGIVGTYADSVTTVMTVCVHADRNDAPGIELDEMPEVQATYVIVEQASALVQAFRAQMECRTIPPSQYGSLDSHGHSA